MEYLVDLLVPDLRFTNRREKIYKNMWYIIFKFRKYLNCETLEMFKYMHGTSCFLMLWKIFELKKIFRNRREKICGTSYLNLENI
jgi:hypothetical protein